MRKLLILIGVVLALAGCQRDAEVVSHNLSFAADNFEVDRRVIFYNSITDTYIQTIEGKCSIEVDEVERQLIVTCKVGPDEYKKEFLGLSDNVTYFVQQLETADVSEFRYRVVFKPSVIVPDPEFG